MPKLSYLGSILPIPTDIHQKIDNKLLRFIVPHGKTFLDVSNLSANFSFGGIGLANINLHCEVMLIRGVMFYLKNKIEGNDLTSAQYYIEYYLYWDQTV